MAEPWEALTDLVRGFAADWPQAASLAALLARRSSAGPAGAALARLERAFSQSGWDPAAAQAPRDFAQPADQLAQAILAGGSEPASGRALALAVLRLADELPRLLRPASSGLGRGFEALRERRWRQRLELPAATLNAAAAPLERALDEPAAGRAELEAALRRPLTPAELAWFEDERRCALLDAIRAGKTDSSGHIRSYVVDDPQQGPRRDRLGVEGWWELRGAASLERLVRLGRSAGRSGRAWPRAASSPWTVIDARALPAPVAEGLEAGASELELRPRWRRVTDLPALELLATPRHAQLCEGEVQAAPFELARTDEGWCARRGEEVVAQWDGAIAGWWAFAETLERLSELAPVRLLSGPASPQRTGIEAWLRELAEAPRPRWRARLVYVPSTLEHPLGGVPEVGIAFLADRIEALGGRAHRMKIRADTFDTTLPQLLGADLIGIGVYIHNRGEVAELCARLRRAGFPGRILLGGPEARSIDELLTDIPGWDAIIRGEAEDALPEVLALWEELARGDAAAARRRAERLRGVALRWEQALWLCDTAHRNRAAELRCPLPFRWRARQEAPGPGRLKMNLTRGCPYLCEFCPNHQGRAFRAAAPDELWRIAALAVADALTLPEAVELALAEALSVELGIVGAPLELALSLAIARPLPEAGWARVARAAAPLLAGPAWGEAAEALVRESLGVEMREPEGAPRWQAQRSWLAIKLRWLAERQRLRAGAAPIPPGFEAFLEGPAEPFVLETSEDNTLVNRSRILAFLEARQRWGLSRDLTFNPGQNTIRDLLAPRGGVDEAFLEALVADNPFEVAFGVDGTSNAVLRQQRKPLYKVEDVVAVQVALGRRRVRAACNYILLAPETNLVEAIEAFALWLLLPIPWRDYGGSTNLRVIKEETTLATDEGRIFAPGDEGWDVPLRDPRTRALIARWEFSSMLSKGELEARVLRLFAEDEEGREALEGLPARWLENPEADRELRALGQLWEALARPGEPAAETLRRLRAEVARGCWEGEWPARGVAELWATRSPEASASL